MPLTGTETFHGHSTSMAVVASDNPVLTIAASGLETDTGTLSLGGTSPKAVLHLAKGNLDVTHQVSSPPLKLSKPACTGTETDVTSFIITGGTGAYRGATGHGSATVTFTGVFARANGACDPAPTASPVSGSLTFSATGTLTLR
jgi:hypothetical protein